jgi:hypothetical protein
MHHSSPSADENPMTVTRKEIPHGNWPTSSLDHAEFWDRLDQCVDRVSKILSYILSDLIVL